jgi:hypothetical protein
MVWFYRRLRGGASLKVGSESGLAGQLRLAFSFCWNSFSSARTFSKARFTSRDSRFSTTSQKSMVNGTRTAKTITSAAAATAFSQRFAFRYGVGQIAYRQNSRFGRGAPQDETADDFYERQMENIKRQIFQAESRGQPADTLYKQLDRMQPAQ